MSLGLTPSVVAAENRFANAASVLWSRFESIPTTVPLPAELGGGIAAEQTADLLRVTVAMLARAGVSASNAGR